MSELLKLEIFKSRRRHVWDALALLVAVQLLWAMWATRSYARHGTEVLWPYGLFMYSTINCLIMPIAVAVLASRLSDIEHKAGSYRLLSTMAEPVMLYAAKYLWGAVLLAMTSVSQAGMLVLLGKLTGFAGVPPWGDLVLLVLSTFLCSLCLLALQQALSMLIKNQMITLVVGLGGGFIGLFALYLPSALANLSIWSLFMRLSSVQVDWAATDRVMQFMHTSYDWPLALGVLALVALIYSAGQWLFVRKEW